jgi:glutamate/tyrosine decarboxylase-like PLP-dependent enzyme
VELTQQSAQLIEATTDFELALPPSINTVIFRYRPSATAASQDGELWCDTVNDRIRIVLLQTGEAVIGYNSTDVPT